MTLIGISGKKQTGKDTVADIIQAHLKDNNIPIVVHRISFADALYEEVAVALWPAIQYVPEAVREKVAYIKAHKNSFRLILQGWGTDYRRMLCGANYWVNKWLYKVNLLSGDQSRQHLIICSDCRFLNELKALQDRGAYVWRIERAVVADGHPSETELDDNQDFTAYIDNNGSLDDLRLKVLAELKHVK